MEKQMLLPLDLEGQDRRRRLWKQIPKEDRMVLVALYSKLIADAVRDPKPHQEERDHEVDDR